MSHSTLTRLTVLDNVPFGNPGAQTAFYALRLSPPAWDAWQPGQFVMLRPVPDRPDLLWGRPFAICRVTGQDLVLFFQVVGRGTSVMSRLEPGDQVDVWGPLGNAFAVEPRTPTLLLAGGIGIVPFVGYVQRHPTSWEISMEFGHRMPLNCYPIDSISGKIMVNTHLEKIPDDRERFLMAMKDRIQEHAEKGLVLACGPSAFLRTVQELALRYKARTQLCLETRMACGIGACLGCVVKAVKDGGNGADAPSSARELCERPGLSHVQTCTCGPIFWADSVVL